MTGVQTCALPITVPTGWDLTSATCSDGSPVTAIDLSAGEAVTCTFTNTKRANLTIVKNTVGGDGTFPFTTTGGTPLANFNLTTTSNTANQVFNNVPPGNYSVTEGTLPTGWQFTSLSCTTGGTNAGQVASIVMPAGGDITCTFTNTKLGTKIGRAHV